MSGQSARRSASVWPVLLSGLALATVVTALAGFLAVRNYAEDRSREQTRAENSATAVAAYADLYLREHLKVLQAVAASPPLRSGDLVPARALMRDVLPADRGINGIVLVDANGDVLTRTEDVAPSGDVRINLADREYVRQVLRTGRPYVGQVLVLRSTGVPAVALAVPVRDARGVVTSVLVSRVHLPDAEPVSRDLRLGDDDVVVADRERNVVFRDAPVTSVTGLDPALVRFVDETLPSSPASDTALSLDASVPVAVGKARYVRVDGDRERLLAAASVPVGDWVVLVDRDAHQLLAPARQRLERTLAILAVLMALGVAAVAWSGWRLARSNRQQARIRRRVSLLAEVAEQAGHGLTVAERSRRLLHSLVPRVADVGIVDCLPDPHRPGRPGCVVSQPAGVVPSDVRVGATWSSMVELPLEGSDGPLGRLILGLRRDTGRPAYAADDEEFLADVARVGGLSVDHALAFEREHEALLTYQRGLLPAVLPEVEGLRLDPAYQPGDTLMTVGGDWYDAFALPGGRIGLVVGDVVGHGVAASSAMGQLRSATRALGQQGLPPAGLLSALDRFAAGVPGAEMTTMVYVELDPRTGELVYSRAGHLPPLILDATGRGRTLDDGGGLPLASFPMPRSQGRDVLGDDGTLLLFTDGVVERRGEDLGDGVRRLERAAAATFGAGGRIADATLARLDLAGSDDTCLLVVRREPRVVTLPEGHPRRVNTPASGIE